MSEFCDHNGNACEPNDPNRELWYSVRCGYWTDDWSKVRHLKRAGAHLVSGIPCCPVCQMVGMQISAGKWEEGAETFDRDNPGYLEFLNANKEHCFGAKGLMASWRELRKGK